MFQTQQLVITMVEDKHGLMEEYGSNSTVETQKMLVCAQKLFWKKMKKEEKKQKWQLNGNNLILVNNKWMLYKLIWHTYNMT